MWIKTATYIALEKQVSAQSATIEWMRQRVNQLERKNALLESNAGIPPIDVMQIERVPMDGVMAPEKPHAARPPAAREPEDGPLVENADFEDMGDDRAKAEGVSWDSNTGQVSYNR